MNIQNNKRSNVGELPLQPQKKVQKIEPPPINVLPSELLMHIFSFLEIADLMRASHVNEYWSQAANSNVLWKPIAEIVGYRLLDAGGSFKTQILPEHIRLVKKFKEIEKDVLHLRALIPSHLMEKPKTVSKLKHLGAWRAALHSKTLVDCIGHFTQNTPEPITSIMQRRQLSTDDHLKLAGYVMSQNIIQVWNKLALAAQIPHQMPNNLETCCDPKVVNSTFSQWIDDHLNDLHQVEILQLTNLGLIMLPDGLQQLKDLKVLNISKNLLHSLPEWISNLTNLETLHLYNNHFTYLPEDIKDLNNLKELNFGYTQITEIPDWISNLSLLEELAFPYAPVKQISQSTKQLKQLEKLDLSETNITSLPSSLSKMDSLSKLTITTSLCQQTTEFPPQLKKLRIRVYGNEINMRDQRLFEKLRRRNDFEVKIRHD
jgi:hypothetical protein